MPDDKKKYPWIKSIFGSKKKKPVECVYAGPEVMKNRFGRTEKVYAGPEIMDGRNGRTGEVYAGPPIPKAPVYAGPEFYRSKKKPRSSAEGVYAGPEFFGIKPKEPEKPEEPEEPVIEEVYAGPEFFGIKPTEPEKPEEPEEPVIEEVYAGPEFFGFSDIPDGEEEIADAPEEEEDASAADNAQNVPPAPRPDFPPRPMTMTIYAGPQFYNPRPGMNIGAFAPQESSSPAKAAEPTPNDGTRCPFCGAARIGDARFCTECGALFQKPAGQPENGGGQETV